MKGLDLGSIHPSVLQKGLRASLRSWAFALWTWFESRAACGEGEVCPVPRSLGVASGETQVGGWASGLQDRAQGA